MFSKAIGFLSIVFFVSAAWAQDDDARLHKLFDDDHTWTIENYPEEATAEGLHGENDRWTDMSRKAIDARRHHPDELMAALNQIDRAKLTPEDQLNYDLFKWRTERDIEAERFPEEFLQALDPLQGGVHNFAPMVLEDAPSRTVQDYQDQIARLQKLPALIDQNIALLREGLAKGVTQPKIVLRDVPGQVDRLLKEEPSNSVLLTNFRQFPQSISADEQAQLKHEASAAVDGEVDAALRRYRDFLEKDYIPNCRETIALSSLPDGKDWYRYRTLVMTTTDLTPEQIHAIGEREVKRIRAEMDKTITDSGFHGSFDEFVHFLRTDPSFYYTKPEDLVIGYRDICKRIDGKLPLIIGKLPRTTYGVEPIDAFNAPSQTTAFYEPGPVDGSRSATYRVNTYKLDSRPKFEMEVLSSHESVPGHHIQIALAHELENVPEFRKQLETTAFVEGWALYSESLGYEIGLYKDPYSKFGQLSYDMWRACRLVVDTGMHAMGWTRQQAIDFMKANTALTEQNIVVEVDRYISWPGQADAYKLGQLKIRELRTRAEQRLGNNFDERQFHNVVLDGGALPLEILEKRVNQWIDSQADGQPSHASSGQ